MENILIGNISRELSTISSNEFCVYKKNNKLEFLGDTVYGFVITNYLYKRYSASANLKMINELRTKLVCGKNMSKFAHILGLSQYIIFENEKDEYLRYNDKVLEDVFEAFCGGIFIAYGLEHITTFIINLIEKYVDFTELIREETNYKSVVIEYCQKNKLGDVRFHIQIHGDGITKPYTIVIKRGKHKHEKILCTGIGFTKRDAEEIVSQKFLSKIDSHEIVMR